MYKVKKIKAYALIETELVAELKRKLTVRSTGKKLFTLKLYTEDNEGFWVPRTLVSNSGIKVEECKSWYAAKQIQSNIILRPEQQELKDSFLSALSSYSPYGGILSSKTGSGKTVIMIDILTVLGGKTLIVVPTTFLMNQWKSQILKFTNLTEDDIGIIQQNRCEVNKKSVVIGMLHSLAMKKYTKEIYSAFHNVLFDEIHRIPTEVFSKAVSLFHAKYLLGTSATPRRKDGTENVFKYSIGNVIAKSTQLVSKPKVILLPYVGLDTNHLDCVYRGELSLGKYMNRLEQSRPRTVLLANIVYSLYKKNEDILLLSDRIQMLQNIKQLLIEAGVPKNIIGLLIANQKESDKKIILGTYGSAGLGADIPRLSALVFATPRTDIEQPFGRVTRVAGRTPVVIDVVDIASSIMLKWMYSRLKFYKTHAGEVNNKIHGS